MSNPETASRRLTRRKAIGTLVGSAVAVGAAVAVGSSPASWEDYWRRHHHSSSSSSSSSTTSTSSLTSSSSSTLSTASSSTTTNLSRLIAFNTRNFDTEVGLIPNPGGGNLPGLGWTYLNGQASPSTPQINCFEPNENWKIAAYIVDSTDPNLASMGSTILQTLTHLNAGCHWHAPWKDEALLGYPTPYSNQNVNPGFSFTPSYGAPLMQKSNGTQYQILQACAVQQTGAPCTFKSPNLNAKDGTTINASSFDEGLFQVANRFIRNDLSTAQSLFQQATSMWDGTGFAGSSGTYRGMFLGVYLYVNKLIGANSPIASAVEAQAWSIQNTDGGIARNYTSTSKANSDNETSNALLLSYADPWIARVQAVAASGKYNLQTVPFDYPTGEFP